LRQLDSHKFRKAAIFRGALKSKMAFRRGSFPLLAPNGHAAAVASCLLLGVDRKSRFGAVRTAFDPERAHANVVVERWLADVKSLEYV
jgi:hypothetical protein